MRPPPKAQDRPRRAPLRPLWRGREPGQELLHIEDVQSRSRLLPLGNPAACASGPAPDTLDLSRRRRGLARRDERDDRGAGGDPGPAGRRPRFPLPARDRRAGADPERAVRHGGRAGIGRARPSARLFAEPGALRFSRPDPVVATARRPAARTRRRIRLAGRRAIAGDALAGARRAVAAGARRGRRSRPAQGVRERRDRTLHQRFLRLVEEHFLRALAAVALRRPAGALDAKAQPASARRERTLGARNRS